MATRTPLLNYYEILGVPRNAGLREIEDAYRAGVVAFRDQPGGSEQTRRINLAYRALSDADRRRDYDTMLGGVAAAPAAAEGASAGAFFNRTATADLPVEEPLAREEETSAEHLDDEPPVDRSSRSRPLLLLAALAGLLLIAGLLAASWLQRDGPKVAASDPQAPTQTNGPGATSQVPASPADERGWLEETLADVASLGEPPAPPAPAGTEAGIGAAPPADPSEVSVASAEGAAETTAEAAPEPAPSEAADARPADGGPRAETGQAAAAPPVAAAPAVQPAVDRSAPARLLSGGLYDADNRGGRFTGSVGVRLQIGANGRVQNCRVSRSSGNGELDSTTCRLLSERLIFSPALNRSGAPVTTTLDGSHVWGRRQRR